MRYNSQQSQKTSRINHFPIINVRFAYQTKSYILTLWNGISADWWLGAKFHAVIPRISSAFRRKKKLLKNRHVTPSTSFCSCIPLRRNGFPTTPETSEDTQLRRVTVLSRSKKSRKLLLKPPQDYYSDSFARASLELLTRTRFVGGHP